MHETHVSATGVAIESVVEKRCAGEELAQFRLHLLAAFPHDPVAGEFTGRVQVGE